MVPPQVPKEELPASNVCAPWQPSQHAVCLSGCQGRHSAFAIGLQVKTPAAKMQQVSIVHASTA